MFMISNIHTKKLVPMLNELTHEAGQIIYIGSTTFLLQNVKGWYDLTINILVNIDHKHFPPSNISTFINADYNFKIIQPKELFGTKPEGH